MNLAQLAQMLMLRDQIASRAQRYWENPDLTGPLPPSAPWPPPNFSPPDPNAPPTEPGDYFQMPDRWTPLEEQGLLLQSPFRPPRMGPRPAVPDPSWPPPEFPDLSGFVPSEAAAPPEFSMGTPLWSGLPLAERNLWPAHPWYERFFPGDYRGRATPPATY